MGNRASNLVLDYLPEDPTPGYHGQLYVNSETQRLRINIRGTWVELAKMTDLDDMEEDLRKIKSDKFVSPSEKVRLRDQLKDIEEEYKEITSEAFRYGLDSSVYNEAYRKAVAALRKYTEDSPDYIPIDGDFDDIAAYYPARTAIKEILAEKIKEDLDGTRDQIEALQAQVDGVVESFSGQGAPTLSNYPADEWTTDEERKRHARDIYTDITPYVDDETTPTSGHAWKWYYNGPADYGWVEIADSEAVKAMVLARMSVLDTDVLFVQTSSQTLSPALPIINESGIITNPNGWSTDAPEWRRDKYIWQTTYVRKGDGAASFSKPTCISGRNGTDGVPGAPGKDGQTTYTWIRYADNAQGGGISNDPTGKEYIGFAYNKTTPAESDSPSDYTWSLIKGTDGVTGAPGKDGQTTYTWIKYSDNADGTGMYDIPKSTTKYIGIAVNKTSQAESSDKTDYTWSLFKGADGTSVTITSQSVTYQASSSGTSAPTGTWQGSVPAVPDGQYLWTKTTVSYSDGTSTTSYSVSRQGVNGTNGIDGANGRGVSSTVVEYQIGTSGTTAPTGAWSTSIPAAQKGKYLWTRTTVTYTSGNPSVLYSVAYYATDGTNGADGKDGIAGKDGVGISSTVIKYAKSASSVTAPTSGWQSAIPSVPAGQYLWTWTRWTYTDNTMEDGYSVARQGENGQPGADGTSVTVTSTEVRYAKGNYPSQPADSLFTLTSVGSLTKGQYLWTRTVVNYSDGATTKSYTAAYIGSDGSNGAPGAAGADGKTSYTHFAYASGITGSLPRPSAVTGFSTTSFVGAKYIGVCSDFTPADPTTHASYEWSEYKGADGVGVASITEQYYLSTSRTQLNGGSWSDERPDWVAGRYYWTRSKITYTDGQIEYTGGVCVTGEKGDSGQNGESTYLLDINNEAIGVACNSSGTVIGSFPFTYARVYKGSTELTSGVSYSIYDSTNIEASVVSSGQIYMSDLRADTAQVIVQAQVDGLTLRANISVYKVRPGADGKNGSDGKNGTDGQPGQPGKDGSDGKDARVYSILTSVDNVTRKIDGTLSASSVTCTKYLTVGTSGTTTTTEKYLYAYRVLLTGVAEAASLIAGPPAVSGSVTITDKTAAVVFELRDSNSSSAAVLDRERVPVLADSGELQERLTDIEYLKKIFPEGTLVSEGAIIAKLLGVSGDGNEVEAGINGSDLGKDDTHGKVLIFAGAPSVQDLASAVTIIYEDGTIKTRKLEALDGSFSGILKAVSGSFTSLQCVNAAGEVVGTLRFGTAGDITHENCDLRAQGTMNGRSLRYYAQDVWVRDQLGAYSRTAVVIEGTTAKYYTKGLYSSSYVSITLTSKTTTTSNASSANLTYYDVKLYSPETTSPATLDASGFPVDLVIIKKSGTASSGAVRYNFICAPGKKFSVVNANDDNNYVYFFSNGSPYQLYGGHAAEAVNVGYGNLLPTVSSLKLGAGLLILSEFDNNW